MNQRLTYIVLLLSIFVLTCCTKGIPEQSIEGAIAQQLATEEKTVVSYTVTKQKKAIGENGDAWLIYWEGKVKDHNGKVNHRKDSLFFYQTVDGLWVGHTIK
ncbi:hypothetical protein QNI19_30110 [Cytophagaceae bacterium DM2B3-1]|uniref:NTF2 fold domain-containing protein n=1 Tax=Xanthocytophaga flava TaxID=3048013 RepID=A0ABT7CU85_9BACT|nr:hypothetical protein [Xanthocytophaga flavus]MDJ1472547.1 hypothetical protein [Xanthocytophaga flavus]MDJ1497231.1 hypothetical protein [Xanthocytophaga flavus]